MRGRIIDMHKGWGVYVSTNVVRRHVLNCTAEPQEFPIFSLNNFLGNQGSRAGDKNEGELRVGGRSRTKKTTREETIRVTKAMTRPEKRAASCHSERAAQRGRLALPHFPLQKEQLILWPHLAQTRELQLPANLKPRTAATSNE